MCPRSCLHLLASCAVIAAKPYRGLRIPTQGPVLPDAVDPREGAYVTFVEGLDNLQYAAVMVKSMQKLNHTHPNVIMVRQDSAMATHASALEQTMSRHGWNAAVELFDPVDMPALDISRSGSLRVAWKEAWQRIAMFKLGHQYKRVVHLDADTLVFKSLDGILRSTYGPTFARRMGACLHEHDVETEMPVTNLFVSTPNLATHAALVAYLDDAKLKNVSMEDEASVISRFLQPYALFRPEQLFYYNCFAWMQPRKTDQEFREFRAGLPDDIHVLHLGQQGRSDIQQGDSVGFEQVALKFELAGQLFRARAIRQWHNLLVSHDVQEVIAAAGLEKQAVVHR